MRLEALSALNAVAPMAMNEHTLRTQVQILVIPTPLVSEIREALNFLENNRLIVGVREQLGEGVKWSITDSGKAKLAEAAS